MKIGFKSYLNKDCVKNPDLLAEHFNTVTDGEWAKIRFGKNLQI